jgi:hypothetical protein
VVKESHEREGDGLQPLALRSDSMVSEYQKREGQRLLAFSSYAWISVVREYHEREGHGFQPLALTFGLHW